MPERESEHGREVRAARNQSRFRAVSKRLADLNETLGVATSVAMTYFLIACECADPTCIAMVTVRSDEYEAGRTQPRRFAVLPGHVYDDVEQVVGRGGGYVIVEKFGSAGEATEGAALTLQPA
jgi:hypothetical protein